jgi:hypothetical protein
MGIRDSERVFFFVLWGVSILLFCIVSLSGHLILCFFAVHLAFPLGGRALLSAEEVKPLSEGASVGAVRGGVVSNDVLREGALVVLRSRGFIPAVKYVRETAGWGLLESKAFVDGLRV